MKVIYQKRIEEKLSDAIQYAEANLRKIERIEITREEMDELRSRMGTWWERMMSPVMFLGVRIVEVN